MQLKSFIARVTRDGSRHKVLGFVLNDGTPLKSVEVRVDDGPWQPATLDAVDEAKYSWKLFTYAWKAPAPGEHTIVSRVTDVNGKVQPTAEELENKKTFLEDNAQFPRSDDDRVGYATGSAAPDAEGQRRIASRERRARK